MKIRFLIAALFCLLSGWASAQPYTPVVYVNEKLRLVELARSQRATVRYDLAPIGGEHLTARLYRHDQNLRNASYGIL